jgi:hypothetical protein
MFSTQYIHGSAERLRRCADAHGALKVRHECASCHNTGLAIHVSKGFFPSDPPKGTLYQAFCSCDAGIDRLDACTDDPTFTVLPAACTICNGTGIQTVTFTTSLFRKGGTCELYCPCIAGDVRMERDNRETIEGYAS